ncbi:unnamed protein product [Clonostachys rhizophaga]|uniref:TauD/TfdA-like domain-containing protein n=1 Tax=Clonostachys rhizophaga TaxID=160324 RepID=A0A9N9VMM4_9HYPO|nr:unnamed protein product [Clonostachys rhizophaga]
MATATIQPYELYSDAPGFLLNKPEWEEANAAHPGTFDFGKPPQGWPTQFTGPDVWTGDYLEKNPDLYIKILSHGEISEIDSAIKASLVASILGSETVGSIRGPVEEFAISKSVGLLPFRPHTLTNYFQSITHLDPSQRGKIYVSAQDTNAQMYHSDAGGDIVGLMAVSLTGTGGISTVASAGQVYNHLVQHRPDIARLLAERKFRWRANGIPEDGVRLIHNQDNKVFLNFSTRTFIGYGELPDRDRDYPPLTFEEREAFGGWQWVAEQYSLKTQLEVGDIEWVNNLHHQHARRGFTEDVLNPRHLLRVWLTDSEHSPRLPADIQNKFDAMFESEPDFYPLDEIEEDQKRRETGVFTGSCKDDLAAERLENGGIVGTNQKVAR